MTVARNVSRETSPQLQQGAEPLDAVRRALEALGAPFGENERALWARYVELFDRWARRTNLVSLRDRERWIERHVVPSLALLRVVPLRAGHTVVDIGTGAGFPGLPLALVRRDCQFYLIESRRWRVLFLEEVVQCLELSNVQVLGTRVEDQGVRELLARRCDRAVARAVADLATLWEWAGPLLKENGRLVAYKGRAEASREMARLVERTGESIAVEVRPLPWQEKHTVVVILSRKKDEEAREEGAAEKNPGRGL